MDRPFPSRFPLVALAVFSMIALLTLASEPWSVAQAQIADASTTVSTATSTTTPADASVTPPPATTPSPANTGAGEADMQAGATNPVAILLGAVALAGILSLGGRLAIRRRSA